MVLAQGGLRDGTRTPCSKKKKTKAVQTSRRVGRAMILRRVRLLLDKERTGVGTSMDPAPEISKRAERKKKRKKRKVGKLF